MKGIKGWEKQRICHIILRGCGGGGGGGGWGGGVAVAGGGVGGGGGGGGEGGRTAKTLAEKGWQTSARL